MDTSAFIQLFTRNISDLSVSITLLCQFYRNNSRFPFYIYFLTMKKKFKNRKSKKNKTPQEVATLATKEDAPNEDVAARNSRTAIAQQEIRNIRYLNSSFFDTPAWFTCLVKDLSNRMQIQNHPRFRHCIQQFQWNDGIIIARFWNVRVCLKVYDLLTYWCLIIVVSR